MRAQINLIAQNVTDYVTIATTAVEDAAYRVSSLNERIQLSHEQVGRTQYQNLLVKKAIMAELVKSRDLAPAELYPWATPFPKTRRAIDFT